ncbi:chaplin family protein [Streptomyces sp. NPDC002835]
MRQVTRKGLITVAAAGGVLALGGGYAQAGAGAHGEASNSPGVLSGNSVQAPVHVPVNICGNTVDVIGLLNPTFGNQCANVSGSGDSGGGSGAEGQASDSPGIASGNQVQLPVDAPVNVCGNSVDVGGLLNPAFGNECASGSGATPPVNPEEPGSPEEPGTPNTPETPNTPGTPNTPETPNTPGTPNTPETPSTPGTSNLPNTPDAQAVTQRDGGGAVLAETGMDALDVLAPAGVGLLLAGTVLYRRSRAAG